MILLIDNYDSFTWNLVQRLGEIEPRMRVEVHRNDCIDGDTIAAKQPSHLLISPGPCNPDKAGISCDVVRRFAGRMPILGVCLGHQAVGQVFGGKIVAAKQLMHGKVDQIEHTGRGLFTGLSSPIEATRPQSGDRPGISAKCFRGGCLAFAPMEVKKSWLFVTVRCPFMVCNFIQKVFSQPTVMQYCSLSLGPQTVV